MSFYFSNRAFFDKFGSPRNLKISTQKGCQAGLGFGKAASLGKSGMISGEYSFSGYPDSFSEVLTIMRQNGQKPKRVNKANRGELVCLYDVVISAGAFPIESITPQVRDYFEQDLSLKDSENRSNCGKFHIFGGKVTVRETITNIWSRRKLIYLLGSVDNLASKSAKIMFSSDVHRPNSHPSGANAADFLINQLYGVTLGPRMEKSKPSADEQVYALEDMLCRTITGGMGYSYNPDPNEFYLNQETRSLIGTVSAVGKDWVLIRPIVIE